MAERDFNLQMTGEQVKDALQQLEDRVAEGWAVGEHDGVPVTSGSPYYHNNSAWWAQQAGLSAQAAAESAATAEQEVEDGIREGIAGAYVQESATPGAVVTFDDGADNIPLKDLKVNLAINQPGTGDPSPTNVRPIYPVTEAEVSRTGENLLKFNAADISETKNGITARYSADTDIISITGTSTATSAFSMLSHSIASMMGSLDVGERYTLSARIPEKVYLQINSTVNGVTTRLANISSTTLYSSFTVPDGLENLQLFIGINGSAETLNATISQIQLERGSTATTYTPYAGQQYLVNIGINQWDEEWEVGTIDNSTGLPDTDANNIRSKNFCPCIAGTDYNIVSKDSKVLRYYFYDKDETFISGGATSGTNTIVTAPTGACYFKVRTTSSYGSTYLSDISVNFPSRFAEYRAYTGNVVYGGELDITPGVLPSKYASVDLGTLNYTYSSNGQYSYFYAPLPLSKPLSVCYADRFKYVTAISDSGDTSGDNCCRIDGSGNIRIRDLAYTNAATFKTAMSGAQLVYELATPISIQLTPTEVDTLRGDNVIFCDAGDITNCEYRADLKMYIDKVVGA